MLFLCLVCIFSNVNALAYDKTIEFRNIPWKTNYDTAVSMVGIKFHEMSGEIFYAMPVKDILFGQGAGSYKFENNDINIWAANGIFSLVTSDITVGGFSPASINMYFAYTPVNGILTQETKDSALYAASYTITESSDVDVLSNIKNKLISIYGEADTVGTYNNDGYQYIIWDGANDTVLVLKSDKKSEVEIIYAWYGGDQLLVEADNILSKNISDKAQEEADFIANDIGGL